MFEIERITTTMLLLCAALPVDAGFAQEQLPRPDLKLIWQDEFDGDTLDYCKWSVEQNAFGGGNNELQIYTERAQNVRVAQGHLVIEARRDHASIAGTTREFSSGRLRTKHRGDWKYGYIEVRAWIPAGKGLWPAIWMLPTDEVYGSWAASGEIDIAEFKGSQPDTVHLTLHHTGAWPDNKYTTGTYQLPSGTFADDFHTFAIDWQPGKVEWYIDGELRQSQSQWQTTGAPFPAPFDQKFHLVLNLAVGGHYDGPPNEQTQFPQQMLVDYIRIYQTD